MSLDLTYWRAKLAGETPPITAEDPQHGYYRLFNDPIIIGFSDGATYVQRNGRRIDDPLEASDVWVSCAKNAIDKDIYGHYVEKGMWPEQEAAIEKSPSLQKNIKKLAEMATKAMADLKKREGQVEAGQPLIKSQLEADTAAGYVQQARAMIGEAEGIIKLLTAPLKAQQDEIKKNWTGPFAELEAAKEFFLDHIAAYGKKLKRESNNPDFKFAAGKASDAKTIALKKKETYVVSDWKVLRDRFIKQEVVAEEIDAAIKAIILRAAITAHKAEKELPAGLTIETDYTAV